MFQTTRVPVKVYRAIDPEAPQLSTTAGSLKTLLKACLVTGYGTNENRKEPLGWAMPFEEPFKAAFQSQDEISNRHCLKIDNTNATYAVLNAYLSVDDTGEGRGAFSANDGYDNFPYNNNYAKKHWVLVGHEKAFVLILPDSKCSQILWFGDVPSLMDGDIGNTLYINTSYSSKTSYDNGSINTTNKQYFALNATGTNKLTKKADVSCISLFWNQNIAYPDEITGGLSASEVYLTEKGIVRGLLPGLLSCANNLQSIPDLQIMDLGDRQNWVKLNLHDTGNGAYCFLLNLTAWEA